jgi:hypothetical protein
LLEGDEVFDFNEGSVKNSIDCLQRRKSNDVVKKLEGGYCSKELGSKKKQNMLMPHIKGLGFFLVISLFYFLKDQNFSLKKILGFTLQFNL